MLCHVLADMKTSLTPRPLQKKRKKSNLALNLKVILVRGNCWPVCDTTPEEYEFLSCSIWPIIY